MRFKYATDMISIAISSEAAKMAVGGLSVEKKRSAANLAATPG